MLPAVVLVSMLVGSLAALGLASGQQAQSFAARDRNYDSALAVTEAGIHQAVSQIEARVAAGEYVEGFSFSGEASGGTYDVTVTRTSEGIVVDSQGGVGGASLERSRRIEVTLVPPQVFPDQERYALFSYTSIELKNEDVLVGDVWANDSLLVRQRTEIEGAVTSAQSWIQLEANTVVEGNATSGGYHPQFNWSYDFANGSSVDGAVKAAVSAPEHACQTEMTLYEVRMANTSSVTGGATTCGQKTGTGSVAGTLLPNTYTAAPAARPLPVFTYASNAYDPDTHHSFTSVADFQSWLSLNGTNLSGTFYVTDAAPSQSNRIDLTGVRLGGDTTIITNAPVFTNSMTDQYVTDSAVFGIITSYQPPVSSGCDVNHDSSDCAVHVKNNFDSSCKTAVLIYASNGPIAVKNNQKMCGTIAGDGILVKNNQEINYDGRIERFPGFGDYEVGTWQELPPQ